MDNRYPDIEFVMNNWTKMKLKYEKPEYRAYKCISSSCWQKTRFGSLLPDPLIRWLKETEGIYDKS